MIEDYWKGNINYKQFYSEVLLLDSDLDQDELASFAVHILGHYETDQDIMEKEPEYKKYMGKEIYDLLKKLKESVK